MEDIVFENVVVTDPPTKPFKDYYDCENVVRPLPESADVNLLVMFDTAKNLVSNAGKWKGHWDDLAGTAML